MKGLGVAMMVGGFLWAALGAANIVSGFARGIGPPMGALSIAFNGAVFLFPGTLVLGLGAVIAHLGGAFRYQPTALLPPLSPAECRMYATRQKVALWAIGVLVALALLAGIASIAFAQDALRYVIPNTSRGGPGWAIWKSYEAFRSCGATTLEFARQKRWPPMGTELCPEDKLGQLDAGTKVERLDSPACRDMAQVRVLDGGLKGKVGCFPSEALTSIKPEE